MMNSPEPRKDKKRILVVDDHPLLREGIAQLINLQADLMCCGQADSVPTAVEAAGRCQPDLILLDFLLGLTDALALIKSLRTQCPKTTVLVLSQFGEPIYAQRALQAGAMGYVVKQEATEEVLQAIRTVLGGELYVSRRLAGQVLQALVKPKAVPGAEGLAGLSDREFEVFRLIGSGQSMREIAVALNLSFKTVETHRENIKRKMGLATAAHVLHEAAGWLERSATGRAGSDRP